MASKSPVLLTPQERERLTGLPSNLTEREVARHYTLSPPAIEAARIQPTKSSGGLSSERPYMA